ncbi:MAG: cytochrome c-type biogenesis protein [Pseudomonadota bacterium]
MRRLLVTIIALWLGIGAALAVTPEEILDDPALEARARALSAELRCLVCQNESIDASNAELAKDLRVLVRDRLVAGDTDEEVLAFVVDRYGEFVLLRPTFSARNAVLWATPIIVLALGAIGFLSYARRSARPATSQLSEEEEARIAKILDDGDR